MRYYRVLADDKHHSERWFLDAPILPNGEELDPRGFGYGVRYSGPKPEAVLLARTGHPVSFNLAAFDMPVVSQAIAERIKSVSSQSIECFPVAIGSSRNYSILNVLVRYNCVDEHRSKVMKWTSEDGRKDKIGKYRMITNLTINPDRLHESHIFRIEGWEVALIVSETLKKLLEDDADLGVAFTPVA